MPLQNLQLFGLRGIRHANLHQEAVQLRFGQRIGAFKIDRVLRREHGEPARQRAPLAVDRHLPLFHAFQQRSLGARRHAVDLVHQQQIGKHRPGMERERVRARAQDRGAEDVGRHQVGRGLHALKAQAQQPPQRFHHQRLGDARHAFKQRVTLAQHGDQHLLDRAALPGDHPAQFACGRGRSADCVACSSDDCGSALAASIAWFPDWFPGS